MAEGIQKRDGGKWQAQIQLDGQRYAKTFDSHAEAQRWRAQMKADHAAGTMVRPQDANTKLGDWMERWLDAKGGTVKPSTWDAYERLIRLHYDDLNRRRIGTLRRSDIQLWVNDLAERVSPSMGARCLSLLTTILRDAAADRMIGVNPAESVNAPQHKPRKMTFLEPHELDAVLSAIEDEWARDVVMGLAFIGCRFNDLANLTVASVDRVNGRIWVEDEKTGNDRWVPVAEPIGEVVERRLAEHGEWLFTSDQGYRLNLANFRARRWNPAVEAAGLGRHVRPHDLRHTCASWLIATGANPVQVAAWLGHSNPTQTLNTYAHLWSTDFEDMAAALTELWDRGRERPANVMPMKRKAE